MTPGLTKQLVVEPFPFGLDFTSGWDVEGSV